MGLLSTCQVEFESLPATLDPPAAERSSMDAEGVNDFRKKTKNRALANVKFIGYLYLRGLLPEKLISTVTFELLSTRDIQEHKVECALELLQTVGPKLDNTEKGQSLMQQFIARLTDLKRPDPVTGKTALSKRVQMLVQDLFDSK